MKTKFYLIAMCTSMFCLTSAYGQIFCPRPDEFPEGWKDHPQPINGWEFDKWKDGTPTDPKTLAFVNSWLYTLADPRGATCLYRGAGGSLHLKRPDVNLLNHHYEDQSLEFNVKNHGIHCVKDDPGGCKILEGADPHLPPK